MEDEIFKKANNREEYYHMLAETIYLNQKAPEQKNE